MRPWRSTSHSIAADMKREACRKLFGVAGLLDAPFHVNEERFGVEVDLAIASAREDDRLPQLFPVLDGEEDTTFLINVVFVLAAEHFAHSFRFWMGKRVIFPLSSTNYHLSPF